MFDPRDGDAAVVRSVFDDSLDASPVLSELRALAVVDVSEVDEQALCEAAIGLQHAQRVLAGVEASVLAELDGRGTTDTAFGLRTGAWLADRVKQPVGAANQRVRAAVKLRVQLPDVADALLEGRIGADHARVLERATNPRNAAELAPVAGQLCDLAERMTFDRWRQEVQGLAERFDQDGAFDPDDALARNRLRFSRTGDTAQAAGQWVGENALITDEVLNSVADELFTRFSNDHEITPELKVPDRATLLGLAFVEICRRAAAGAPGRAPRAEAALVLTPDDLHHRGQRSCTCHRSEVPGEDPVRWIEGAVFGELAQFGPTLGTGSGAEPGAASAGFTVSDAQGRPLPPRSSFQSLLCDAEIYTVVVDTLGVPLDMGHAIRFANRAQRRAMARRDGGCVFPGCTAPPSWIDAHHIEAWHPTPGWPNNKGRTDVRNLLSLCRYHHGIAHRRGWGLQLTDDGWSLWSTPGGDTFWGQRNQHQRAGPIPAAA